MNNEEFTNRLNWLRKNAPDFDQLSNEEVGAILHFAILWSFFEAEVLENNASANRLINKANEWHERELLKIENFEEHLTYFQNRYIDKGAPNERFDHLNFRRNDNEELTLEVLADLNNDIQNIVSTLLIIVYRYRNNFFHGIKWEYNFAEQFENFQHANRILKKAIELNRKL